MRNLDDWVTYQGLRMRRDLANRAQFLVGMCFIENGTTVTVDEAYRPVGVESDMYVPSNADGYPAGPTSSNKGKNGSTQWFQWGRQQRGETSAAYPGESSHGSGRAGDFLQSDLATRRRWQARAGLAETVAREVWHLEPVGPMPDDVPDYTYPEDIEEPAEDTEPAASAAPERTVVDVIGAQLGYASELVQAALTAGVPLAVAAALLEKETGGANVFGHDAGGAMYGAGEVTEENFREFLAQVRAGATSNGVGPLQITWPGYLDDAEARGIRLWVPAENIAYGLGIIATLLNGREDDDAIRAAGEAYNGNASYGDDLLYRTTQWRQRLAGVPIESEELTMADISTITTKLDQLGDIIRPIAQDVDRQRPFRQIRHEVTGEIRAVNYATGGSYHIPNMAFRDLLVGLGILSRELISVPEPMFIYLTVLPAIAGASPDEIRRIDEVGAQIEALAQAQGVTVAKLSPEPVDTTPTAGE